MWAAPPVAAHSTYIDANKTLIAVTDTDNFGRDLSGPFSYDYGAFYPYDYPII